MSSPVRKKEISEVLQKIGRNVLLFQLLENQLKTLLTSSISGYVSEIQSKQKEFIKKTNKMPMGDVTNQLLKKPNTSLNSPPVEELEDLEEPWISITYSINSVKINENKDNLSEVKAGEDHVKARKKLLKELVVERNKLVHHFYEQWPLDVAENRKSAMTFLDSQSERIQAAINKLGEELYTLKAAVDRWISSPEFQAFIDVPDE